MFPVPVILSNHPSNQCLSKNVSNLLQGQEQETELPRGPRPRAAVGSSAWDARRPASERARGRAPPAVGLRPRGPKRSRLIREPRAAGLTRRSGTRSEAWKPLTQGKAAVAGTELKPNRMVVFSEKSENAVMQNLPRKMFQ